MPGSECEIRSFASRLIPERPACTEAELERARLDPGHVRELVAGEIRQRERRVRPGS